MKVKTLDYYKFIGSFKYIYGNGIAAWGQITSLCIVS